ncbi:uncharacterized protein LOC129218659 isoform X2 [Uloborus diversus]|uniref:uncharacterized protein LOC129218659 isoform X2 n=1 Tax=Uloborus diversus TaxID=327109 RepID=UPI002409F3E3|nr:uncharacterized protein LOC129218659 isoform X2 [Uloborus diversus]
MVIRYTMVGSQVGKVFNLLSTTVGFFWKMGTFLCYEMPKRTITLYIRVQKTVLYMPFRYVTRLYAFVCKYLPWSTSTQKTTAPSPSEPKEPNVLTFLTNGDTRPKTITEEMRKLVVGSAKAIDTMESRRKKLRNQRHKLESWAVDNEKKTNEMFQIAVEEKQMIKVIAAAVQRLKTLKSKREKVDSKFSEGTRKFFANGTSSASKILENKTIVEEFLKKQMDENGKIKVYNNMLGSPNNGEIEEASSEPVSTDSSEPVENKVYQFKIKQNSEILQGIEVIKEENIALKQRLSATNEKLEWFLETSDNLVDEMVKLSLQFAKVNALNKEISELQTQLAEGREMLCAVQTDRDEMKAKLKTLEGMIKEEEDYLGYENSFESGFEDFPMCNGMSDFKEPLPC